MASIDAYEEQIGGSEVSIGQHYTLVKRIAFHLRTRLPASIATDDLIQAGMEGLIHAQRAYEPSRGIDFEMFAKTRIRGAMLDEVRRISYSTRSAITMKREQDQAISTLSKELGRQPKSAEVAQYLDKDIAVYEKERLSLKALTSSALMQCQLITRKLANSKQVRTNPWKKRK